MPSASKLLRRALLGFVGICALVLCPIAQAGELWEQVEAARADGAYADVQAEHRLAIRDLFAELVAWACLGAVSEEVVRRAAQLGFIVDRNDDLVLLRPSGTGARSDGVYAVRIGVEVPPLILQAPHAYYDLQTGPLTARLFEQGFGRVACFNSAHRNAASAGDLGPVGKASTSDLAHRPYAVFQAATLGMVDALDHPLLVQLHGFGGGHGGFSAVVSRGSSWQPSIEIRRAVSLLEPLLASYGPLADGDIVPELAGRTNVQGRVVGKDARFLHLELSLPARSVLNNDAELRADLGSILTTLAEDAP